MDGVYSAIGDRTASGQSKGSSGTTKSPKYIDGINQSSGYGSSLYTNSIAKIDSQAESLQNSSHSGIASNRSSQQFGKFNSGNLSSSKYYNN